MNIELISWCVLGGFAISVVIALSLYKRYETRVIKENRLSYKFFKLHKDMCIGRRIYGRKNYYYCIDCKEEFYSEEKPKRIKLSESNYIGIKIM